MAGGVTVDFLRKKRNCVNFDRIRNAIPDKNSKVRLNHREVGGSIFMFLEADRQRTCNA